MTPSERVFTTLDHREPDRVPIDFGATMETTAHVDAYALLKQRLGRSTARSRNTSVQMCTGPSR